MIIDIVGKNGSSIARYRSDIRPVVGDTITLLSRVETEDGIIEPFQVQIVSVDHLLKKCIGDINSNLSQQLITCVAIPLTNYDVVPE